MPTLAERWLPGLDIGLSLLAAAIWYVQPQEGVWPLGFVLVAWLLRRAVYGYFTRRTALDVPLLLFLLSAWVSATIGYNQDTSWTQGPAPFMWAWGKFWYIVAAVALYYAIANLRNPEQVWKLLRLYALLGAVVAVFFVCTNDWSAEPAKFDRLTQLGLWLTSALPRVPGLGLRPNVAGGLMAMLAPFCVPFLWQAHSQRRWREWVFWVLVGGVTLFGLLLSASRGAWIALGLVGVGWFLARQLGLSRVYWADWRKGPNRARRPVLIAIPTVLAAGLIWLVVNGLSPVELIYSFGTIVVDRLPGGVNGISRLTLLKETWPLAQDYFFTGGGLGAFPMLYSTYALLTPVFILPNGHNLLLDVLIEQGVLGLLAFLAVLAVFTTYAVGVLRSFGRRSLRENRAGQARWVVEAALVSAIIALAHSMVEDVSYGSIALVLLFVPPALTIAVSEPAPRSKLGISWRWVGSVAALMVLIFSWQRNLIQSMWYANLGALGQAQVELSRYHWPDHLPDTARKDGNLSEAVAFFKLALQYDAGNRTANQRLGAIELARGDYNAARDHLEVAFQAEPLNESTWQLLGDTYLATGRLDDAFTLWSKVSDAAPKLEVEAWARYEQYGDYIRAEWARELARRVASASVLEPKQ